MPDITNKEWIDNNNLKIDDLITQANELPDYQDLKPLYATGDFVNYGTFVSTVNFPQYTNTVSFKGNYIVAVTSSLNPMGSYSDRYALADLTTGELYTLADRVYSTTNGRRASIVGETDDYVYISRPSKPDNVTTTMEIYKYDKTTHTVTTTSQNLGSNMNVYLGMNVSYEGYVFLSRTYYIQLKFNTTTEVFDFIATPFSFSTLLDDVNKLFSINSSRNNNVATLYKWSDLTHSNYISKSISGISGVNWDGTKIFQNGNVYVLNSDLTTGTLLKSNCYTYIQNETLYGLNDKYYLYNNKLYSFDETTNTLSLVDNINTYYLADSGKIFRISGKTMYLYSFTNTSTIIGFIYEGIPYINSNNNIIGSENLLINHSITDISGNIISGTMPNNGQLNYTPTTSQQIIPAGYTSGGTIEAVSMTEQEIQEAEDIISDLFGEEETE